MSKLSSINQRVGLLVFASLLAMPSSQAEISLGELNLVARRWGVDQGKNGLQASSIAQTSDGSLWIGNHDGIHRLKGQQVTHHETATMPEIGSRHIQRMCIDPQGTLWLNSRQNDIASFQNETFTRAKLPEKVGDLGCWCPHAVEGVVACYIDYDRTQIYWITLNEPVQLLDTREISPRRIPHGLQRSGLDSLERRLNVRFLKDKAF